MAQTLEELFRSKVLDRGQFAGKTAADGYDIRNSKDIRISTSEPLVNNTGFVPARLLRKTLGIKGSESLLEEELTGLRVIRGFSTPVIYGSELGRITLRTTPSLDLMKTATMGELSDDGGSTITVWKRLVNAPSFSKFSRYSSRVVAPIHWISPLANAGFRIFEASSEPEALPAPIMV